MKKFSELKLVLNLKDFVSKMTFVDGRLKQTDKELEEKATKAREIWGYGNQIASIMLDNLTQIAEGTRAAQAAQTTLSILQKVQSQIAVVQTTAQASAAFAAGNVVQGIALMTIAASMQATVIKNIALEVESAQATKRAEEIARQISAYRSG